MTTALAVMVTVGPVMWNDNPQSSCDCELRHKTFAIASNHFPAELLPTRGDNMRKAYRYSSASKTVVEKLTKLGYLKGRRMLTNKMVRLALERLRSDLCRKATIQDRVQRSDDRLQIEWAIERDLLPPKLDLSIGDGQSCDQVGACADKNSDPRQSHVPVAIGQV